MGFLRKLLGKDTTTDVLELLAWQHRQVDGLFEQLESREGDRQAVFTELADRLAAHTTVEEKLFYPAVMAQSTEQIVRDSLDDHLAIKRVLADLLALRTNDEMFEAKLGVLKEQFDHHAHEEEEANLFPKVRDLLTKDERAALGNELIMMFEQLMPLHPYKNVARELEARTRGY
jgi:hemerythrin superfamily protein